MKFQYFILISCLFLFTQCNKATHQFISKAETGKARVLIFPPIENDSSRTVTVLRGKSAVTSGVAGYILPVDLPPGTAAMDPELSIVYSNIQNNEWMGMGFDLTGMGSIERTGATVAQDGFPGGVSYGSNDRFSLNGQRLILINGTYGADQSEYRTEIESWKKVVANGQCGSGPCSFDVTAKNGLIYEYGTATDAQVLAYGKAFDSTALTGSVRSWLLNKVTDRNGNSWTITYTTSPQDRYGNAVLNAQNTGVNYPLYIDYTINANADLSSQRRVSFYYENRPDTITRYVGGGSYTIAARLSNIQSSIVTPQNDTLLVKNYQFTYDSISPLGISRIQTIQVFASDTTQSAPLTFNWSDGADTLQQFPVTNNPSINSNAGFTGDFNGDGITDLISTLNPTDPTFYFSKAGGFIENSSIDISFQENKLAGDFNGDGLADILTGNTGMANLYLSNLADSSGFKQPIAISGLNLSLPSSCPSSWTGDFNGDGLTDVLSKVSSAASLSISTGTGFNTSIISNVNLTNVNNYVADFNADGMTDILSIGTSSGTLYLSACSGEVNFTSLNVQGFALSNSCGSNSWVADFNGDGLPDLLSANFSTPTINYNNGNGFESYQKLNITIAAGQSAWLGDYNGDGRMDIYNATLGNLYYSNGNGFTQTSIANNTKMLLNVWGGDFNGDGATDLFTSTPGGQSFFMSVNSENPTLTVNQAPHLLTSIDNGAGATLQFAFKPITDTTVYSKNQNNNISSTNLLGFITQGASQTLSSVQVPMYPSLKKVRSGIYVVSAMSDVLSDSSDHNTFSYFYNDGIAALNGRGWLGFNSETKDNISSGKRTIRYFNQEFPLTGKSSMVQTSCLSNSYDSKCTPGAILGQKFYIYSDSSFTKGIYQVETTNGRTDFYDYGKYSYSLGETYSYDQYSNLYLKAYMGYVDQQNNDLYKDDNVYTINAFENDTVNWQLGFLSATKVSSSSDTSGLSMSFEKAGVAFTNSTDFSLRQIIYSDDQRMNVTAVGDWDNTNNCFITTSYSYDMYGNRTSVTRPSGGTIKTSFDNFYHTFPDTKTTPGNQSGKQLQYSLGYDPRFGKQTGKTDFNGNVFISYYNGFGQLCGKQGPLPDSISFSGSSNMFPSFGSGSFDFSQAKVISLMNKNYWVRNGQQFTDIFRLQSWPSADNLAMSWTRAFVNGHGKTYRVIKPGSCNNGNDLIIDAYYRNNQLVKQSNVYAKGGQPFFTTYQYDVYGRNIKTVYPSGVSGTDSTIVALSYQLTDKGVKVQQINGLGESNAYIRSFTSHYFNGRKRIIKAETLPANQFVTMSDHEMQSAGLKGNIITNFHYDRLGRNTKVSDPKSGKEFSKYVSSTSYDSRGRKIRLYNPAQGESKYIYNTQGRLVNKQNSNGLTTFQYDSLGRVISKTTPDSSVVNYTYDGVGNKNGNGHLTFVSQVSPVTLNNSSYSYGYDDYGNKELSSLSISGKTFNSVTQRDPAGRIYQYISPNGKVLSQHFSLCHLDSVSLNGITMAQYDEYNDLGIPEKIAFNNGVTSTYDYSPQGLFLSQKIMDSGEDMLLYDSLSWNNLNQLEAFMDKDGDSSDLSQTFTYDQLRLKEATGNHLLGPQNFDYDETGNLTRNSGIRYIYNGLRLIGGVRGKDTLFTATYSKSGNLLRKKTKDAKWNYEYDAENRLLHVHSSEKKVNDYFGYDYRGQKTIQKGNHGDTRIYVDGFYEINLKADSSYSETNYVIGQLGRVASYTEDHGHKGSNKTSIQYFHKDNMQSTVLVTNQEGKKSNRISYSSYGAFAEEQDSTDIRFKYTDKEFDKRSGLYYFGSRYYDPFLGRFITADNGLGGSYKRQDAYNRYAYAFNSPLNYTDPDGHAPIPVASLVGCMFTAIDILSVGLDAGSEKNISGTKIGSYITQITASAGLCVAGVAFDYYKGMKANANALANGQNGQGGQAGPAENPQADNPGGDPPDDDPQDLQNGAPDDGPQGPLDDQSASDSQDGNSNPSSQDEEDNTSSDSGGQSSSTSSTDEVSSDDETSSTESASTDAESDISSDLSDLDALDEPATEAELELFQWLLDFVLFL